MKTEYEDFLEATADSNCMRAHEFNNRANARAALGRHNEALNDYGMACALEPDNPSFLLNQAELFIDLGMIEKALSNVRKARQLGGSGDVTDPHELYYVARMFLKCNEPEFAEEALIDFLRFLLSIIPYTVRDDMGGYIIKKDGHTMHISGIIDFEDLDHLVREINEVKGYKDNMRIKKLSVRVKASISSIS